MKSLISKLAVICFALFGLCQATFAQVAPVKSGDVLKLKIVPLVAAGQVFTEGAAASDTASVQIDTATGERTYTTAKNKAVVRKNNFFGTLQWNRYVYKADEIGNILPPKITIGEKWKEVVWFNSSRCGRGKNEYEVTVSQGQDVVVNIKGVPTSLKTFQIIREGTWFFGNCGGSGKKTLKVLFSPELNEIVHDEYKIYDKGFADLGEITTLDSID